MPQSATATLFDALRLLSQNVFDPSGHQVNPKNATRAAKDLEAVAKAIRKGEVPTVRKLGAGQSFEVALESVQEGKAQMDWPGVVADYAKQGWGITQIAHATGLSPTKVRQLMTKANKVDPKKAKAEKDAYLRKTFPDLYKEDVAAEVAELAEAIGNIRPVYEATEKDSKGEVLAVGDTVRDKLGDVSGTGVIKAIEVQPGRVGRGPITIQWKTKGHGSGWRGRDLVLVKKAAKEHRSVPFEQLDALLADSTQEPYVAEAGSLDRAYKEGRQAGMGVADVILKGWAKNPANRKGWESLAKEWVGDQEFSGHREWWKGFKNALTGQRIRMTEGDLSDALPIDQLDDLLTQTSNVPGPVAVEVRGSIGPGGIEPPKNVALVAPGRYYMGASSSPKLVIITAVGPESITYYDPYDGSKRTMQRWIAEDLIAKGTATWLKTYGKYHPKDAAELKKALEGKPPKKTKLKDWDRIVVHVQAKSGDPYGETVWRAAERYGSVGGMTQPDGSEVLEIRGFRKGVEGAKKDPNLTNYKEVKILHKAG